MTVWGKIKREREEGRGVRGVNEEEKMPCYKVSKHVFYKRHFSPRLENNWKKEKCNSILKNIPLPAGVTLDIFHTGLGCTCFWGQQSCFCHRDVSVDGDCLLLCWCAVISLALAMYVPSSLFPDLYPTTFPSPPSAHRIPWPSVSNYTFYWHFCCHIFLFRKAVTS